MPRHSRRLPSRDGFTRELAARTERLPADDPERQVEALRQFQKAAMFCGGARGSDWAAAA